MKRTFSFLIGVCIITLFFTGCQSVKEFFVVNKPTKVTSPEAPYLDENIEVVDDRVVQNVDRTADIAGKTARLPVRFWNKVTKSFRGVKETNPYERSEPFGQQEFQAANLADHFEDITQPVYLRGEKYTQAYRSPFIFKPERARGGTTEMVTVSEAAESLLAKQYLDFQKELEDDLDRAEQYLADGKYSEALELVEKVLNMDSSSRRGRILFEKIIREREQDKIEREKEARERIANNEKISQYIVEARSYLEDYNFAEAMRIAEKAVSVDPSHNKARELVDTIELAKFEHSLKASGTSSLEILERMIYKHLNLYQQYSNEGLDDLAKKELRKVSILESYRDKMTALKE